MVVGAGTVKDRRAQRRFLVATGFFAFAFVFVVAFARFCFTLSVTMRSIRS
jgi:hypothetical protein